MAAQEPEARPEPVRGISRVGMPAALKLEQFGSYIRDAFGHYAVHVGSSLRTRDWNDVDVRLLLSGKDYCALFGCKPKAERSAYADWADMDEVAAHEHWNANVHMDSKWVALCLAFSAFGKEMTGLPIDFQIMPGEVADHLHPQDQNPRHRIGFTAQRFEEFCKG